jgi:predicted nucleic acid-binding protein
MNVVDSSGWLEYFAAGPNAKLFLPPLRDTKSLIVPVISIYEVFKVVLREADENAALQILTAMKKGIVAELTSELAIAASKLSLEHKLPMADSIILATARSYGAQIWTQDADFKDLPDVRYFVARRK